MIPANVTLPLSVKTSLCANGETVELRLMLGTSVLGGSVFVNGQDTSRDDAVKRLLSAFLTP